MFRSSLKLGQLAVRSRGRYQHKNNQQKGHRGFNTNARTATAAGGMRYGLAAAAALVLGSAALYALDEKKIDTAALSVAADEIPFTGLPGTRHERTFIAVKPDGVQRNLVSKVIKRFTEKGYKLVAIKMVHPTPEFAAEHYADLAKKPFFPGLIAYFSSGPVVAMVWEGRDAILGGRRLLGATVPADSAPGSLRGGLCVDVGRNICHGSDGPDSARDEISLWFKPEEVCDWEQVTGAWVWEKYP